MADANLTAVLQIRDQMSSGFAKVQQQLASVQQQFEKTNKATDAMSKHFTNLKRGFNQIASSISEVSGLARVFTLGFIINEIKSMIRATIDLTDTLDKMSKVTGIGVEQLQKYQFAARMANVTTQEFQGALRILQLRAEAARSGSEEARISFLKIGIGLEDLNKIADDTNLLFRASVDGLAKLESRTAKMATGNQLFGRTFAQMSPLIEGGTKELDRWGQTLQRMGGIISQQDVDKIQAANRQFAVLQTMWEKLRVSFIAKLTDQNLLELIVQFAERGIVAMIKFGGEAQKVFNAIGTTAGRVLDAIIQRLEDIGKVSKSFLGGSLWSILVELPSSKIADLIEGGDKHMAETNKEMMEQIRARERLAKSLKDTIQMSSEEIQAENHRIDQRIQDAVNLTKNWFDTVQKGLKDVKAESEKAVPAIQKQGTRTMDGIPFAGTQFEGRRPEGDIAVAFKMYQEDLKQLEHQFKLTGERAKFLQAHLELLKTSSKKYLDEITKDGAKPREGEIEQYKQMVATITQLEREVKKLVEEEARLIALQEKLAEMDPKWGLHEAIKQAQMEFMTMKDVFLEVFNAMERGFSEAIQGFLEGGKKFRDRMKAFFKDIGNSFKKMLADMIAQQLKLSILNGGGGAAGLSMAAPGIAGAAGGGGGFTMGSLLGSLPLIGNLFQPAQFAQVGKNSVQTAPGGLLSGLFSGGQGILGLSPGITSLAGLPLLSYATQSDDPGKGGLTGAAGGFMTGMGIGGPIGGVIGALGGALLGAFSGSKGKQEAEKAKEEQEEAVEQAQEALEEQRRQAQSLILTHLRTTYGGGLATTQAAEEISQLVSGGVSVAELEQFGGPEGIVANAGAIQGAAQTQIDVGGVTINATITGPYDVDRLADDFMNSMNNLNRR